MQRPALRPPILQRLRARHRPDLTFPERRHHIRRAGLSKTMGLPDVQGARVLRRRLLRAHEPPRRRGRQGPRARARPRGQGRQGRVQEYSEFEALKD